MKTRPGTMDRDIVDEMENDPYLARNHVKNRDIVLDCGANIGSFAKFVLSFAPQAKVICIEPMPSNIEICRENLKDEPSCVVMCAALMGDPGTVAMYDFGPTASLSFNFRFGREGCAGCAGASYHSGGSYAEGTFEWDRLSQARCPGCGVRHNFQMPRFCSR